jgi:mitochondrial fission protein ELM1
VSDGKAGTENQALGLAEALGLAPVVKRVRLRPPWRWFSPHWRIGNRYALGRGGDPFSPPWPAVLISAGRHGIAPSLALAATPGVFRIHLQDPRIDPAHFDLVVAPEHDAVRGPNVVLTRGAITRITPAKLAEARERFAPLIGGLPGPRIAALIGGRSRHHDLSPAKAESLGRRLVGLAARYGGSLLVSTSRRTGAAAGAALRAAVLEAPHLFFDPAAALGENPYLGFLAWADFIVVTNDSVSMASDAATTGTPIFVDEIEGHAPKLARFHAALAAAGVTRPLAEAAAAATPPAAWRDSAFDDAASAAAAVCRRWRA